MRRLFLSLQGREEIRETMGEKEKGRSRKKKTFPVLAAAIAGAVITVAAAAGAGYYIYRGKQYETVFFLSTSINGIDASEKSVEQMKKLISREIDGYVLTIKKRGGETEQITGEDIGLHPVFDGKLEEYLADQDPLEWWSSGRRQKDYEVQVMREYDEGMLEEKIGSLELFQEENMEPPRDAYLSEYVPGQGYVVMPEEPGTVLDKDKTAKKIAEAVANMDKELVLEELDVYEKAAVTREDPELNGIADKLNKYANMTVTYTFGEKEEILDGNLISQWIAMEDSGEVSLNQEAVTAYVEDLASRYDTANQKKLLKTSYGQTVEITKGFYGWKMDRDTEAQALYEILMSGQSQPREPVYLQTGASHGENDYGDTYVEINLTAQHLFFYKDGRLLVESDFVSGNAARGYSTPAGAYPLTYKQRNATLRGADYATPVSYWMPFNRNIGMHDAGWRGSFGGSIYKTNGSHGCINLPRTAAKTIFENIEKGMPVLCYHLEGTESGKSSRGAGSVVLGESDADGAQKPSAAEGTAQQPAPAPTQAPAPAPAPTPTPAPAPAPTEAPAPAPQESDTVPETSPVPETESQPAETETTEEEVRTGHPWEYGPGTTRPAETEGPDMVPDTAAAAEEGGTPQ